MSITEAIVVGIVQGLTEFLPISSDGHLALVSFAWGLSMSLTTVVALHAGTLLAVLWCFRQDAALLGKSLFQGASQPQVWLRSEAGRVTVALALASCVTAVIGLSLEKHVEAWAQVRWIVGLGFVGSALATLLTLRPRNLQTYPTLTQSLILGAAQGLAVLPGLSRSGMTIGVALALGLRAPEAFRFSFLLSIPAVAGAVILKLGDPEVFENLGGAELLGIAVAFVAGWAALFLLRKITEQGKFWFFSLYLLPLGAGLVVWDLCRTQ